MALILLLLACGGATPAFPGAETRVLATPDAGCATAWRYPDRDGDGWGDEEGRRLVCADAPGWVDEGGDCDDTRADVYPDAEEHCDGVDHDCDGLVDEDDSREARAWFPDLDGDGEGGPLRESWTCAAPPATVDNRLDCDDTRADVNTRAAEVCDAEGVDEDCDGWVNDEDWSVSGGLNYWVDRDRDGYGSAEGAAQSACELPDGGALNADDCDDADPSVPGTLYTDGDHDGWGVAEAGWGCPEGGQSTRPGDCDDADPEVNPGVRETDCSAAVDENCDGVIGPADGDGDGVPNCEDCDDADPEVYGVAEEVCDGLDQDCDGEVDEDAVDAVTWYRDRDGDGFGSDVDTTTACSAPLGYEAVGGDCDDGLTHIHPGADEYCGGTDYDCDGEGDEEDAIDCVDYHVDADLDGYGAPGEGDRCACRELGEGYSTTDDDCDDTDPSVHPGWEDPRGGGDENCDGSAAFGELLDPPTWSGAAELSLESSTAWVGDLDGDGEEDVALRYDDGVGAGVLGWSGARAGVPALDDALFVLDEPPGSGDFGAVLRGGVDLDGDGVGELIVTDPARSDGDRAATVYLYSTDLGAPRSIEAGLALWEDDLSSRLGEAAAAGRDGDAVLLVLGDPADDGGVWIFDGPPRAGGRVGRGALSILPDSAGDELGAALGEPRDLDGDGVLDLVVGAPGSTSTGRLVVFLGPFDADRAFADFDDAMVGAARDTGFPAAVSTAPDWDADGLPEVVAASDGRAVVTGPVGTWVDSGMASLVVDCASAEGGGIPVLGPDIDGDGSVDLVVGEPGLSMSTSSEGGLWFVAGPAVGHLSISDTLGIALGGEEDLHFPDSLLWSDAAGALLGAAARHVEGDQTIGGLWRIDEESWR